MRLILGVLGLCVWSSTFSDDDVHNCTTGRFCTIITMRPAPPRENIKLLARP